jgi:RNA polymerase sigma-70 factor, ECF subfamily
LSISCLRSVVLSVSNNQLELEELARALYAEHAAPLLTYVQRLVNGDRQLAEDIVQETLLRAWRHADQLSAGASRPWLFTTARHLVIDSYRARSARPVEASPDVHDGVGEAAVVDDFIDTALDAALVGDALRALSDAHRSVLIEAFYYGRTAAQIAAEHGLPPGTVRSRIHYALRALRLALQERGVDGT